jgi:hypothetical protein
VEEKCGITASTYCAACSAHFCEVIPYFIIIILLFDFSFMSADARWLVASVRSRENTRAIIFENSLRGGTK